MTPPIPKGMMVMERTRRLRITRDTFIVMFALSLATYEIILGGARPAVLTFLVALLASPLVIRVDEARRPRTEKPRDDAPVD